MENVEQPQAQTPEAVVEPKAEPAPEMVSKSELEKVLSQLHKFKNEANKYKQTLEEQKIATMKEQNQWKELAEAKEREALESKQVAERVQQSYLNEKKYGAVLSKAQSLGLLPTAVADLELLDLEGIQVETTSTGKINPLGADKFVERLKAQRPHWFGSPAAPTVNSSHQRIQDSPSVVTPAMILAAEKEGKKSGDLSKYQALFAQYQKQRLTK